MTTQLTSKSTQSGNGEVEGYSNTDMSKNSSNAL